jgi:acetyl-CoA carboxylase beta subunit
MKILRVCDKEFSIAFNKCVRNGIKIYPRPTSNGTYKQKARVKLIVDNGTSFQESKEIYSQDNMEQKIIELYILIANRMD